MITDFIKVKDVSDEVIKEYAGSLLEELWKKYGFGTFYNGYLKIINPSEYKELFEASYFQGNVSIPVFATAFGDIITWEKWQFLGIVRYRYGDNDVISDGFEYFIDDVTDGELDEEYLSIRQYNNAVKKYGSLAFDECFGYTPLLALGSIDNLKKVKIREHIALINEIVGEI